MSNDKKVDPETVLLTGASGFIGLHCVKQLIQSGYKVRGTVRSLEKQKLVQEVMAANNLDTKNIEFNLLDLNSDSGWEASMVGCKYVIHVASPFWIANPKNDAEMMTPAVDGTLRALNAAKANKAKKVILTSSVASIFYDDSDKKNYDENDWSDIDSKKITPYAKSKTMAEKSAWEFIDNLGEDEKFSLTVFCPYMVLGPALSPDLGGTNVLVQMLTSGKLPGTPNIHLGIVDVRDVAQAHVDAISNQGSNNERFILCTSSFWLHEISQILIKAGFTKAPKLRLPNFVLRFAALFSATAKESVRMLGDPQFLSNEKVKTILNWQPRPVEETLVDTAKSLEGQDQISIP